MPATLDHCRFEFRLVDESTDEVIQSDYCHLTTIDEFGGCESVDIHVASMLRAFRRERARQTVETDAEAARRIHEEAGRQVLERMRGCFVEGKDYDGDLGREHDEYQQDNRR